jgi:hypothetical protein
VGKMSFESGTTKLPELVRLRSQSREARTASREWDAARIDIVNSLRRYSDSHRDKGSGHHSGRGLNGKHVEGVFWSERMNIVKGEIEAWETVYEALSVMCYTEH